MVKEKKHLQKIHYMTLTYGSRSHQMLSSAHQIIWPLHLQSLKLLRPTVLEKMHLQESTLFDLDLQVNVTLNVAQCPLHHVTYAPTEFEVTTSKALGGEAFTRKFNIWPLTLTLGSMSHKCCPDPLHHVTYPATKFEVAWSNRLGGDTFTRKYIIWSLTLTLGSRSHKMLPSNLNIMWPFQLQSLKLLLQKV